MIKQQRRFLASQRGQMAIFVALIFQVLFVLFAMAINVALVVHDKINLQNAVDLAAYYAAERQAEILNVIAHENYMIRQSWKLLAWRYRALGSGGVLEPQIHPLQAGHLINEEKEFGKENNIFPAVCILHELNWSITAGESLCKRPETRIPDLPRVAVVAPFLSFNIAFAALAEQLRATVRDRCENAGGFNWWWAMGSLTAFRMDQRNRKQVIAGLANNLSKGQNDDFIDLDGNSVSSGAYRTFEKNLTFANSQNITNFQMFNSLQGQDRAKWLPEIDISPVLTYVLNQNGCNGSATATSSPPPGGPSLDVILNDPPAGLGGKDLLPWAKVDFMQGNDYQYSLGVEKNPWVMAYVGVRAETEPRQIFFPFGKAIKITARGYAKPFGGRIGPWYGQRWSRSSQMSSGATEAERMDSLTPRRLQQGGLNDSEKDFSRLPNYSRFPGDTLGLKSELALSSLVGLTNPKEKAKYEYYRNIWLDIRQGSPNDPLAFDYAANKVPPIRNYEIAAISPDLFDSTYYSIEPNFGLTYLPKLKANAAKLGIPADVVIRGDLGQNQLIKETETFSVKDQIMLAQGFATSGVRLQNPEAFYYIRGKENLLTAWLPGAQLYDYNNFPVDRFGRCQVADDQFQTEYKIPGACAANGGRTGYSVRIISRDYLLSNGHQIGGMGEAPGAILNPPNVGAGW